MKKSLTFLAGVLIGITLFSFIGTKFQIGSGGDLWTFEETITATDDFTTKPFFTGGSENIVMGLNFTTFDATKCDCTIYSGTSNTIANGFPTSTSFNSVITVGKEFEAVHFGRSFPWIWATCDMTGPSTVVVGVHVGAKP